MKLTLKHITSYMLTVLFTMTYTLHATTKPASTQAAVTAPVTLQTSTAPSSFTTTIVPTNPTALQFPSFYSAWALPNGNGTIDCTVLTTQNIAPWDQTNVTFCLLGDGELDYSNTAAFIFGAAGGTPTVGNSRTYVYAGTPPAKQATSWNLGGAAPIIDNRADDGKAIVKVDMRFEVSYEAKQIVVKIKDNGADASTFRTIATYNDYLLLNGKNPTAFSNLKVSKNLYFTFGGLYAQNIISNVVVNTTAAEADVPADFSQKMASSDCVALSTDAAGTLAAYSIADNGTSLAVMNQANAAYTGLDYTVLLNTWQALPMSGLPSSTTNQIECFAINGTKQSFIALADGNLFQTATPLPTTVTPPVTTAYTAFGVNKGKPQTITSGQKDVLFVLDQNNALWHQAAKAGTPVTYNAVQEGPKDAAGKYLLLANVSQANDGSLWAVDTAGTVWCAKASTTLPFAWTKCPANTVMVGNTLMSLACKSICGISATSALAITMQGNVASYSNGKWGLLLDVENTPVAGFSDIVGDAASNIALFDNGAFSTLYTNFPRAAGASAGVFSATEQPPVSGSTSLVSLSNKARGPLSAAQVAAYQKYLKASRAQKKQLVASLTAAFSTKTVDEAIKLARAPQAAIVQSKKAIKEAIKKTAATGRAKKKRSKSKK